MMVKLHYAVVADVTVGGARGPENVARLTELELEEEGRMNEADLKVMDTILTTHVQVLLVQVTTLDRSPATRWDNTRFARSCSKHEEVGHEKEVTEYAKRDFPFKRSFPKELSKKSEIQIECGSVVRTLL